jgi:hypothetical protein
VAVDKSQVFFEHGAGGHLAGEGVVGGAALGDDDEAAGVFVEAVDDAGAGFVAHVQFQAGDVGEEGVDEGAA